MDSEKIIKIRNYFMTTPTSRKLETNSESSTFSSRAEWFKENFKHPPLKKNPGYAYALMFIYFIVF